MPTVLQDRLFNLFNLMDTLTVILNGKMLYVKEDNSEEVFEVHILPEDTTEMSHPASQSISEKFEAFTKHLRDYEYRDSDGSLIVEHSQVFSLVFKQAGYKGYKLFDEIGGLR